MEDLLFSRHSQPANNAKVQYKREIELFSLLIKLLLIDK